MTLYYSFEEAAEHKIVVRNKSEVTYSETTPGDPSTGQIVFDKKCQWDMVATVTMTYVKGKPADFNFNNRYTETGVDLDILKVDATDMTTPLQGAQFTLHKLDPENHGSYLGGDAAETMVSEMTDAEGRTSFESIKTGYYEMTETKMPDGYVKTEEIRVYIRVQDGVVTRLVKTADDPQTDNVDEGLVKNWPMMESDTSLIQFTAGQEAVEDDPATNDVDESQAETNAMVKVGNTPGASLPSTGGPGTNLLYLLGSMLIMLAGAGFILLNRKKRAE